VIDNYVFPIVKEQREGLGPSLQNTFFGGDFESLDLYRKSLTEEDRRKNIFELDFGFQYFYNNSQSNYFYRNYNSNAPGIEIQPRFWLTPFLGLHVLYDFSLMNTVGNSPTQNTSTSVTLQNLKFGLSLRRYFSSKPDGSSATFNLNYLDHQFQAPSGDAGRMSIRYRGVDLSMDFSIPSSPKYFWVFGFNVAPNLMGEEAEGSRNFTSGTASTSLLYGGFLGGEYIFSRQFQTYFKFSAQVFKTQFSGTSRASDPVTSTNLSNVSVSDGIYMLTLGVRLGR
jgi:hypothetical protein